MHTPHEAAHAEAKLFGIENVSAQFAYQELSQGLANDHQKFYRYHERHLVASKETIWATAQTALRNVTSDMPKRALILGAGSCADIPLKELTEAYDEVDVVDIDTTLVRGVCADMDSSLHRKVQIHAVDLTGIIDSFSGRLNDMPVHLFPNEYIESVIDEIRATDISGAAPSLGRDYTFVSSHLVHDQLMNCAHQLVRYEAYDRFGIDVEEAGLMDGQYVETYVDFSRQLESSHLDLLMRSVHQEGLIHFAGTYNPREVAMPDPDAKEPLELPDDRFVQIGDTKYWNWHMRPKLVFRVAAYALQSTAHLL